MSKVSVTLNGRAFTIGCEEGQEAYLRKLADHLDGKVKAMSDQVGQIGDMKLLLMASLIVVDELSEAEKRIATLNSHVDRLGSDTRGVIDEMDQDRAELTRRLVMAAERLEAMADAAEAADAADSANADSTKSLFAEASA
jgi:cell division protein ZapA